MSSDEVRSLLQQTQLHELGSRLVVDNTGASTTTSSSIINRGSDAGSFSDDSQKFDAFESQVSGSASSLHIDEDVAHLIIQVELIFFP